MRVVVGQRLRAAVGRGRLGQPPPPDRPSGPSFSIHLLCTQVELNNVRSFYKEAQKSPFKFFPWKAGNMHFRFLPVGAVVAAGPSSWAV